MRTQTPIEAAMRTKRPNLKNRTISKAGQRAITYLNSQRATLAQFSDLEDLILREDENNQVTRRAIEHHLRVARAEVAKILWKNDVFIGIDVIDRLLFDLLLAGKGPNIVTDFIDFVQDRGLHRAGLVLYPLHSFGVLGLGFFRFFEKATTNMILSDAGLAITAQTNSREHTIRFLEEAKGAFGITQKLPVDLIHHFMRSRPLRWAEANPLLAMRVRSFSGTYYENQFIYMLKLRLATALFMMLSVLDDHHDADPVWKGGSSERINNWQTLDIKHYMTFETPGRKGQPLSCYCVPMNVGRLELAQLSDVNVDIDPRHWRRKKAKGHLSDLRQALSAIESGYLNHVILNSKDAVAQRVFRKLIISIDAFRRSFSAGARHTEAVISLAVALEC
jgi:hypothetical protein